MNIFQHRAVPKPVTIPRPPLMQVQPDMSLPYVVATDHAIWGTFKSGLRAAVHADRVALTQPFGERVIVTLDSMPIYSIIGTHLSKRLADRG